MSFVETLKNEFPDSVPLDIYLKTNKSILNEIGFDKKNTILCLSTCRDEITQPLHEALHRDWGETFNLSCLGGFLFCGKTSLKAAILHAPVDENEIERYYFLAMTHIAIGEEGEIGLFIRPNRPGKSNACGALCVLENQIKNGKKSSEIIDPNDIEMSFVFKKISSNLDCEKKIPSLIDLTKLAREIIEKDLEKLVEETVHEIILEENRVQIHGPDNEMWICPSDLFFVNLETTTHSTNNKNNCLHKKKINFKKDSKKRINIKYMYNQCTTT